MNRDKRDNSDFTIRYSIKITVMSILINLCCFYLLGNGLSESGNLKSIFRKYETWRVTSHTLFLPCSMA